MRSSLAAPPTEALVYRRLEDKLLRLERDINTAHPTIKVEASGTSFTSRVPNKLAIPGKRFVLLPATDRGALHGLRGVATVVSDEFEVTIYSNSTMSGEYELVLMEC